jgi:hypothetical protein
VFAFVSAQRNSHSGIIAPRHCPILNYVRHVKIVARVQIRRPTALIRVWRIEEDPSNTLLDRRSRPAHTRPIATADPHAT